MGNVEVTKTMTSLEDDSGVQIKVQTKNLADVLKVEVRCGDATAEPDGGNTVRF